MSSEKAGVGGPTPSLAPNFRLCWAEFHVLRKPTGKLFQTPLTTIFPNSSLSTYAHGVFGSWVNTVSHFPGTDCA
jgi:hypothetical protein